MATRAPIFHLTPEAGRRPKLEIIGVAHAGPYTPADRPDRRYTRAASSWREESGTFFQENTLGWASR
ncbi:MAG: hypothetical protein NTY90_01820 [Candidatus Micrarchaeota archaeon]|nr:hypothetical protein [Candidatus Micrarchaeota archaeon]